MFSFWSLNGYLTVIVRAVLQIDVEASSVLLHPSPVFVDVRRIDDEEEIILAQLIHQQVIDGSAVLVAHHSIIDFAHGGTSHIVGKYMLHIAFRIGTLHRDLTHVRDIKQSYMFTNGHVLRSDTAILIQQRHIKASKRHHRGTQRQMFVVQTCTFLFLF